MPEVPEPYGIVVAACRNFDATWRKVKPQHLLHMPLQRKKKEKTKKEKSSPNTCLHMPLKEKRKKKKQAPHLALHAPAREKRTNRKIKTQTRDAAVRYCCMRPEATSVCGLNL